MRKRKLALALASLLVMPSATTHALGLGEIETRSVLNQPLSAEIKLLSVSPGEIADVTVKLADSVAYVTAGIDKSPVLSEIKFIITQKADGTPVIQLKSNQPIREPFLDFIIEVNWPTGRLLREYTMLLDPPVFASDASSGSVKAPAAQVREISKSATDSAATKTNISPAADQPSASNEPRKPRSETTQQVVGGSEGGPMLGPTNKNDTLWEIAKRLQRDESASIEQVMMALFRANPEAFFSNNVNNLKSGFVLRVPDQEAINAIDKNAAMREARNQYQRWLENKSSSPLDNDANQQGSAVRTDVQGESGNKGVAKGQLKLIAPEGEAASRGGNGKGTSANDAQSLSKELQLAIETGDAARQENDELKARVASLEEQLSTMQRLITLKDDALVDMQNKLGNSEQGITQAATDTAVDASPIDSANLPANQDQAVKEQVESVQVAPAGESILSMLTSPLVLGILVVVGLLLGALSWVFIRRRQQQEADYAEEETFQMRKPNFNFSDNPPVSMPIVEQTMSEPDSFSNLSLGTSEMDEAPAEDSEIDPLAEADVYLAYRRYQQAEDLIKDAILQEPERQDLQVKLLEIYYAMSNKEAFEAQAESFYTTLTSDDGDVWEKVVEMGGELSPDHPLFGGEQAESSAIAQNDFDTPETVEEIHFENSAAQTENVIEFESGLTPDIQHDNEVAFSQFKDPGEDSYTNSGNGMDFNLDADTIQQIRSAANTSKGPQGLNDELEGLVVDKLFDSDTVAGLNSDDMSLEQQSTRQAEGNADLEAMLAQVEDVGFEKVFGFDDANFGESDEDLFASNDMVGTKLDLARAYIDMDDSDGARSILGEVLKEGSDTQKEEAMELIRRIS